MTGISPESHVGLPAETPALPIEPLENEVIMASLVSPPSIPEWHNGMTYLIKCANHREPSHPNGSDWTPRYVTYGPDDDMEYVAMNSCKIATFDEERPGILATSNLNGCTAIAAGYRSEDGVVHTLLEHYDPVAMRELESGNPEELKMSKLLAGFAGQQPVDVVVAYSKEHNPLYDNSYAFDPEDFPIEAILREGQKLPNGSNILFIPYETSRPDSLTPPDLKGHALHVWRTPSGTFAFGWNGEPVEVGKHRQTDGRGITAARRFVATLGLEAEFEPDTY